MSEENKAKLAADGLVVACPACGATFSEPLPGGVKGECADEEDGGCGRKFVVRYS